MSLVLRGPTGQTRVLTDGLFIGRGDVGLSSSTRISRNHLLIRRIGSGGDVEGRGGQGGGRWEVRRAGTNAVKHMRGGEQREVDSRRGVEIRVGDSLVLGTKPGERPDPTHTIDVVAAAGDAARHDPDDAGQLLNTARAAAASCRRPACVEQLGRVWRRRRPAGAGVWVVTGSLIFAAVVIAIRGSHSHLRTPPASQGTEPPKDDGWKGHEGDLDDLFKSCGYTTRWALAFDMGAYYFENSTVESYYPINELAQGLSCTEEQIAQQEAQRATDHVTCTNHTICKAPDAAANEPKCWGVKDSACPKCDGTRMTEHYCARLCTQWFVRRSQTDPLQRYAVIAALREGDQCWCTPIQGSNGTADTWYAQSHRERRYNLVGPKPCAGDNTTTCGGSMLDDGTQLETVVKVLCHSSLTFLVAALVPFVCRLVDCLPGFYALLRLRCCRRCGGWDRSDDQSEAFTMTALCSSTFNSWDDAVSRNSMHRYPAAAVALAAVRLACYLSQPCIFLYLLIHYAMQADMIGNWQKILGAFVGFREAIYFVMTCCCCYWKPSFLLVDVKASVLGMQRGDPLKQGPIFLGLYLMAPEKFVASVLFQPGGLGTSTGTDRRSRGAQATDDEARRNNAYYVTMFGGFLLDLCSIAAIIEGYRTGQLPWSLSFGYCMTVLRVVWMLFVLLWSTWDEIPRAHPPASDRGRNEAGSPSSINASLLRVDVWESTSHATSSRISFRETNSSTYSALPDNDYPDAHNYRTSSDPVRASWCWRLQGCWCCSKERESYSSLTPSATVALAPEPEGVEFHSKKIDAVVLPAQSYSSLGAAVGAQSYSSEESVTIVGYTAETQEGARIELPRGLVGTTVFDLKAMFYQQLPSGQRLWFYQQVQSYPLDQMVLRLAGQPVMGDNETLAASGVTDGATLYVSNKIRGGGGGGDGGGRIWRCLMPTSHESGGAAEAEEDPSSLAFFSAFAPEKISRDEKVFIIEVDAYTDEYYAQATEGAASQGNAPAGKHGPLQLKTGLQVKIHLELGMGFTYDGADGGERTSSFVWNGSHGIAQFSVRCLDHAELGVRVCKAIIDAHGTVSVLLFRLNIVVHVQGSPSPPASPLSELAGEGFTTLPSYMQRSTCNAPGTWDIMISYTQRNADAKLLAERIYTACRERGKTVWLDIKMDKLNEAAMKEAAQNSRCIIAIITGACYEPDDLERTGDAQGNAYFNRDYCVNELRWAREAGTPIQPVIRRDDRDHIGTFIGQAPEDLKDLGGIDFMSLDAISQTVWNTCIDDVLRSVDLASTERGSIMEPEPEPELDEAAHSDTDSDVATDQSIEASQTSGGISRSRPRRNSLQIGGAE